MLDWIASDSRRSLLLTLKRRGSLTLNGAASAIDRAVSTVREHLSELEDRGWVERVVEEPSGRGRPRHQYRLSAAGEALFPTRDAALMRELVSFLQERGDAELLATFFAEFWAKRTERVKQLFDAQQPRSPADRLEILAHLLEEEGFMPEIERDGASVVIRECNCPFPESVKQTRLPCRLEADFLASALGQDLTRVEYIPDGHDACTYTFADASASP
jgi:predicted ArsR family transcriptional regulator